MDKRVGHSVGHGVDADFRRHLDAPFGLLAKHLLQRRDNFRHAESGGDNVGVGKVEEFFSEPFRAEVRIHVGINIFLPNVAYLFLLLTFSASALASSSILSMRGARASGVLD